MNFYSQRAFTNKASIKTFIFSRISDMFLFIFFISLILIFNTTDLNIIFLQLPYYMFYTININCIEIHYLSFLAFNLTMASAIKAAQIGFHI